MAFQGRPGTLKKYKAFWDVGRGGGGSNGPEIIFVLFNLQRIVVLTILPYINRSLY